MKRPESVREIVFEYKGQLTQNRKFVFENVIKQKIGNCGLGTSIFGILRKTGIEFRKYLISGLTIPAAQAW